MRKADKYWCSACLCIITIVVLVISDEATNGRLGISTDIALILAIVNHWLVRKAIKIEKNENV